MTTRPSIALSTGLSTTPAPAPAAAGTPQPASAALASAADTRTRITYLFRAARRQGQIHPLQHLIERYRTPPAVADSTVRQP